MTNALTRKIGRAVPYGSSKVGLTGLTVHMQVEENDRTDSERDAPSGKPCIRFYVTSPGLLKTAFSNFWDKGKEPELGAEVIYCLAVDDKKTYEGGTGSSRGGKCGRYPGEELRLLILIEGQFYLRCKEPTIGIRYSILQLYLCLVLDHDVQKVVQRRLLLALGAGWLCTDRDLCQRPGVSLARSRLCQNAACLLLPHTPATWRFLAHWYVSSL